MLWGSKMRSVVHSLELSIELFGVSDSFQLSQLQCQIHGGALLSALWLCKNWVVFFLETNPFKRLLFQ